MRRILLFLFTFMSLTAFSQIHVKEGSFHQIEGYVMLDKNDHYDDNNRPMALIKISTENISAEQRTKLMFKGNLATYFDVRFEPGEIYLYLSIAATFIEIIHPDYGKTEFWLPEDLKGFCAYEMVLVSEYNVMLDADETFNYLIINTDQEEAMIYINDEFIAKHNIQEPLPIDSTYTWRVECPFYHSRSGEAYITSDAPVSIELKMRPSYGFLNVDSKPSEADVYINGELLGKTPYKSDRMNSGKYIVEVQKKKYLNVKKEIEIIDGNTTEMLADLNHRGNTFLTLDYAYSVAPQHSFGLTFGNVRKYGWYVSAASGLAFDAMSSKLTCDEFGYVDDEMQFYSGEISSSRISIIAGAMYKPVKFMAIKLGTGYGTRSLAWETTDGKWIRNAAYSVNGPDLNAGLQIFINKLSLSLDFVTTKMEYAEIKIGVGVCFN